MRAVSATPSAWLAVSLLVLVLAGPARAETATEEAAAEEGLPLPAEESAPAQSALEQPPYAYPSEPVAPSRYPERAWRYPAAAVDLLLVRPVMAAGLAGSAVLFIGTLPISAATRTTDDAMRALGDQAQSTFTRPLGDF
jgi:hypothetical protein